MIHAAITGSLERCTAILLEHFEGNLPLWLSPVQVKVISVRDTHAEYAGKIASMLKENNIRVDLDDSDENLGKKVREAKTLKIPYIIVVGDKEVESGKVTVENRDKGKIGEMSPEDMLKLLLDEIKAKA